MADEARESIHIDGASPEQIYKVAIDYERYPEWATDVKDVVVIDRDEVDSDARIDPAVVVQANARDGHIGK